MRVRFLRLGLALGVVALSAAEALGEVQPLTIVTLGTSLTESLDWPQRLERRLTACLGHRVRVVVVASSGATSEWAAGQVGRISSFRPDIVLVEFAINDANWRRLVSRARSRSNIIAIVQELRNRNPDVRVHLVTTNVVHGLRGLMRPNIASYYKQYREIAAAGGLGLIDLEPRWAELDAPALRSAVPDGVHPTSEAFEAVALPDIAAAVSSGRCS